MSVIFGINMIPWYNVLFSGVLLSIILSVVGVFLLLTAIISAVFCILR